MKIIIASINPVKVNATKEAFRLVFPETAFEFEGVTTLSEVSDQPISDQETLNGATNRANNSRKSNPGADFYVGVEGGLEKRGEELEAFAWVVIINSNGMIGKGRSATFFLPPIIARKVSEGMELGSASDAVFNESNCKQNKGTVGILTGGLIDRTKYYIDPTILALIPFKNFDLYSQ